MNTQNNTTQHRVNGLLRLLFISAMFLGMATKSNAQVICPPTACPPCMTVEIVNNTSCDLDWAFFYNPDCSSNPAVNVPASQSRTITGTCMQCGDAPCKCPAGINLVIPPPVGGFIHPWGEFSTMPVGNPIVYNNINYPCSCPAGTSFTITVLVKNPSTVLFTVQCI